MNKNPQDLQEAIITPAVWDDVFLTARRQCTVPQLIQALMDLPEDPKRDCRIIDCEFYLLNSALEHGHITKSERDARAALLFNQLEKLSDERMAQGIRIGYELVLADRRDLKRVVEFCEGLREKIRPYGVYFTDAWARGIADLGLAGAHISLCNTERAEMLLRRAQDSFVVLEDQQSIARIEFQKVRLEFMVGRYAQTIQKGLEFSRKYATVNEDLCDCVKDYIFWASVLIGDRVSSMFRDQAYEIFTYQTQSVPEDAPNPFVGKIFGLCRTTYALMDALQANLPLSRNPKTRRETLIPLVDRVLREADNIEADEMGNFLAALFSGIALAYTGDAKGLKKLLDLDMPFIEHSSILRSMWSVCVLEASMLLPDEDLPESIDFHLAQLDAVATLEDSACKVLIHFMKNVAPHALQLGALRTQKWVFREACKGMLIVAEHGINILGTVQKKLEGYPKKHLCRAQMILDVLRGTPVTDSRFAAATAHAEFVNAHGIERVVFMAVLDHLSTRLATRQQVL
ncbi:hypothetical protein [Deinococcus cellulosilyticus]|uniref:Uncharacterized protein n=1 Tax=Deinococcus cellulosilyticus (strain DSM 18568 / NBRC 106333 / KACC 11606 / 5516J-15) TaxID=1223518 RepID=A0A511NAJ2_DEIC1|nr:hypothetical protein [Deinococcus cellulosilyticus]GEM49833.1 hypothetical protein DC3_54680 [Deinococcus cellulosilyticus NBRC 106333 = KACC 11606]